MPDITTTPTFTFPEITAEPPGGYRRDARFKLGEAGEKFFQRHLSQARTLIETFSSPPSKLNNQMFALFRDEKFAQWQSNQLPIDAVTKAQVDKKWNNIRNQIANHGDRKQRQTNTTPSTPAASLPHLAVTNTTITARSVFNQEHEEEHKAAVIQARHANDEDSRQHVGRLATLRSSEWRSLNILP
ncbi:hypothetical protein EYR38_003221 [Pleurotus pulmonarius]|nr:hypothetical protein EYR38_003221 [Pleurotus pulmonarius]